MVRSVTLDCGLDGTEDGGEFDVCLVPEQDPDRPTVLKALKHGQQIDAEFDIAEIHLLAREGGYWGLSFIPAPSTVSCVIPRLPDGPMAWWHALHGVHSPVNTLGVGIRIGVIDEALAAVEPHSPIVHVTNIGSEGWDSNHSRAFEPFTSHSMAICGLIAGRVSGSNVHFQGIAPGAEVFFAAAGEDDTEALDAVRLVTAIDILAGKYQCDIICFSAGDCPEPLPHIEAAVRAAQDRGCLCFVAAGNLGGEALYPACYADCLAVGALGRVGLAPPDTFESAQEKASSGTVVDGLFLWRDSAKGAQVDYLAAGLAVFALQQSGVYSVCGTSYAAPITAGLAAVILSRDSRFRSLPRDRSRATYAIEAVNRSSRRIFSNFCGRGMVIVQ